jgi:predicted DCC family thiol-disulfide oxidoreductase YuxK
MSKLIDRWNRFWFEPQSAATLGFCRLLVCFLAFLYYRDSDVRGWGVYRISFWHPVGLLQHLHLQPGNAAEMWVLGLLWKAAMLTGAIGLCSRISCGIAFTLGLYLVGLTNSFGKIQHADPIILWSFLVLAIARSGDAWSLDCLYRTAWGKPLPLGFITPPVTATAGVEKHSEYRWPLRMMQLLLVMVFCLSGISKLRTSGLAWALSNNFRNTLIAQHYMTRSRLDWALRLAGHPVLCRVMAVLALGAELCAPLALRGGVFAGLLIAGLIGMQIGNEVLLGVAFRQFMICYAFWIPWATAATWARRRFVQEEKPKTAVLFDGSCGLCKRTMAVLRRLDLLQKVEVLDVTNDWPAVSARYPILNQPDCLYTMHVVSSRGKVTTGFFAYRSLCWVIPMGWLVLPFLYLPGVPIVGEAVYQKVADGRFRTGCALPATRV